MVASKRSAQIRSLNNQQHTEKYSKCNAYKVDDMIEMVKHIPKEDTIDLRGGRANSRCCIQGRQKSTQNEAVLVDVLNRYQRIDRIQSYGSGYPLKKILKKVNKKKLTKIPRNMLQYLQDVKAHYYPEKEAASMDIRMSEAIAGFWKGNVDGDGQPRVTAARIRDRFNCGKDLGIHVNESKANRSVRKQKNYGMPCVF